MNIIKVTIRSVDNPKDQWDEEWKGSVVQELNEESKGDIKEYVDAQMAVWNNTSPDKREVVTYAFVVEKEKSHHCPNCGVEYDCPIEDCVLGEEYICGNCQHAQDNQQAS